MTDKFPTRLTAVTGVILAGGRGSRMGGEDKGLVIYHGKPLYQHVLARLQPQVAQVCISANRNLSVYQQSGLQVITDTMPDFPGPLAGMLATLHAINSDWAAFIPCDTPEIPADIICRLWQQKGNASVVWARTAERDHPAIALIHTQVATSLAAFLARGERKVMLFLRQTGGHSVLFEDESSAFANINHPDDL